MLTGRMVRVRYVRNKIVPCYLDAEDPLWLEMAKRLIDIYRSRVNSTRGELEQEIRDTFDDAPSPQIHQGLAKLLEDRCEFAVVSGHPPEEIREAVFQAAVEQRKQKAKPPGGVPGEEQTTEPNNPKPPDSVPGKEPSPILPPPSLNRDAVLQKVGEQLSLPPKVIEQSLYADLRSEQQMTSFKDLTPERLVQRYNVALAQAVLLRATSVKVVIRGEKPARYRQLLRLLKFHRLMCEVEAIGEKTICLRLDGPLSLFSATQKYGLQLALFLPAVLLCKDFEVQADLLWGTQKVAKKFQLTFDDGLVSHYVDSGIYVPPEMSMFVELFEKKVSDWQISQETELIPLGKSFWVPDYQLIHKETGQVIYLEVLGFWRRSSVEIHLERLRKYAPAPVVLAVSDQLYVEEKEWEGLPTSLLRFRQMPLPKEVVKAAEKFIEQK